MSDFRHNEMNGSLFKNDKAEGNQPPYTGSCVINDQEYRVAAWVKEAKNGRKFFSLKFSLPQERNATPADPAAQQEYVSDDTPF